MSITKGTLLTFILNIWMCLLLCISILYMRINKHHITLNKCLILYNLTSKHLFKEDNYFNRILSLQLKNVLHAHSS